MAYLRPYRERENAMDELRTTAWRLIAVLGVALTVALVARLTMGPALY